MIEATVKQILFHVCGSGDLSLFLVIVSGHDIPCEVTWKAAIDGETLIQDNRTM